MLKKEKEKEKEMPNLIMKENLTRNYILKDDDLDFEQILDFHEYLEIPEETSLFIHRGVNYILKLVESESKETVSIMRLVNSKACNVTVLKVDKVKSLVTRKGYGQFLYEYAIIHLDSPIISDNIQTMPGSYNLWKKLHLLQDSSPYEIFVLNESVSSIREYNRTNIWTDYEIWGWDKQLLELFNMDSQCLIDGLAYGDINKEIYHYIDSNPKKIVDRAHIKLMAKRKAL